MPASVRTHPVEAGETWGQDRGHTGQLRRFRGDVPPARSEPSLLPPMPTDKLTDTAIKKAKPIDRRIKVSDGGGLYLELWPNDAHYWRLKYRIGGVEKCL